MGYNKKSLSNLKPTKKGQVLNPNGKKPGIPNSATRFKKFLELVHKKKNPITGDMEFLTVMEQMDLKLIARALKGDIVAYKEVLDRVEGKSKQTIENEISMSMPDLIITPIGPYIKLSSNENEIDD